MFKHMRYKYKILFGCCAPLVLIIITAVFVFVSIKVAQKNSQTNEEVHAAVYNINEMELDINEMANNAKGYVMSKESIFKGSFEEASKGFLESLKKAEEHTLTQEQRERLKGIAAIFKSFEQEQRRLIFLVDKGMQAEAIKEFSTKKSYVLERQIESAISDFEKAEESRMKIVQDAENSAIGSIIKFLVAGTLVTIALAVALSLFIASRLGLALSGSVGVLSTSSAQMAATVTQHEKTASTQAAMVSETSATVSELGVSSQKTAEQATSAADTAKKASVITGEGQVAVRQAVTGMGDLKVKVTAVADSILKLGDQIAQIGNIAEMVKDLAAQTNMLALNAAVEAVRAGEHGKGFAVLASEVRKLADQSKRSAEDARGIVTEIQKATNSTIMITEEGSKTVEKVTVLAGQVGDLFGKLSEAAGSVYDNAQQVLLNARQQSGALGQVVEAVNVINAGSKETVAGLTQTKIGIQNMNKIAEDLRAIV